LFVAAAPAQAVQCGPAAPITMGLMMRFGEVLIEAKPVGGISVQVWANAATGTWTLLGADGSGVACILNAGRNWRGQTINGNFFPAV